jgi:hypothetical protein
MSMTMSFGFNRRVFLRGLAAALVLMPAASASAQHNPNPGIFPPGSRPYGHTYGEWSAKFTQWAYSLPINYNPLADTAPVDTAQEGKVWYIGGSFASTTDVTGQTTAIANRSVTIPKGKALFFPVASAEASTVEGNGTTFAQLSAAAAGFQDSFDTMACEIDGRPVKDLSSYRVQSPLFVFGPLPDDNVIQSFGVTAPKGTTSPSVSDGVFLMLAPLPVGHHTIHFHAEAPAFKFLLDVTYHIKIVPGEDDD